MGSGAAYGGERARINYVANYYKPGPSTARPDEIFRFSSHDTRMFLRSNVIEEHPAVTEDNFRGLVSEQDVDLKKTVVPEPFDVPEVATVPAGEAFELVLKYGGALLPARDAVDQRIVKDVRRGTGRIIDSPQDVGGWPELVSTAPPDDTDGDGMPNDWERSHGLDPNDAADGPATTASGYTNLEQYLNDLAAPAIAAMSNQKQK